MPAHRAAVVRVLLGVLGGAVIAGTFDGTSATALPASRDAAERPVTAASSVASDGLARAAASEDEARLGGRFVFTTGPGLWFAVRDPSDPSDLRPTPPGATFVWATWATTQAGLGDTSASWTFPVVDAVGPVSPASDPTSCLDQGPTWGEFGFEVRPCDGSANQRFEWSEDGTALRDLGTGTFIGTGSTGYDDILQPSLAGGTSAVIDSSLLSIVPPTGEAAPVRITTPTEGETVTTRRPVFSGTGDPGAAIEIGGPMGSIATTTVVGSDWSVASGVDLPDGTYTITVTQRTADGRVTTVTR